ncbi:MAG: 30S ribosomal protein S8 [Syntrophales bacterium]|nr:30S ribosomal protein S8 [Syntrophales bacterium]
MAVTDPIADMLTRIRNANRAFFKSVDVQMSRMNCSIADALKRSGFIDGYEKCLDEKKHEMLRIYLRYYNGKKQVISGLKRISKPGRRIYVRCDEIPRVMNGLGIAILSTSKGILTDDEARKARVGGELLCQVW